MFALFFEELHRLDVGTRLKLVGVALLAACGGNLVRTLFLAWQIGRAGAAAGSAWHDPAGVIVLLFTSAVVFLYSQRCASREPAPRDRISSTTDGDVAGRELGCAERLWSHGASTRTGERMHWQVTASRSEKWKPVETPQGVFDLLRCSRAEQYEDRSPTTAPVRWRC
ncbi:MAG: exosortase/archaeosortase family protein [Candidatus Synoicihabitans palmerolidicus]|nr:exosortase/archaeosortase family protein [Candidatus Synoicihabitans palmerolidicus]